MRTVPGMAILCPGDTLGLNSLLPQTLGLDCPAYVRLGKKGEPEVHQEVPSLKIGKAFTLMEGTDICLLNTGNMLAGFPMIARIC